MPTKEYSAASGATKKPEYTPPPGVKGAAKPMSPAACTAQPGRVTAPPAASPDATALALRAAPPSEQLPAVAQPREKMASWCGAAASNARTRRPPSSPWQKAGQPVTTPTPGTSGSPRQ